jgi:hypothetical protein
LITRLIRELIAEWASTPSLVISRNRTRSCGIEID